MMVKLDENLKTKHIEVNKAVRLGDTIKPKLFILALEDVFKGLDWKRKEIKYDDEYHHHIHFNEVILISEDQYELKIMIE